MYRSSSSTRMSDEFFSNTSASSTTTSPNPMSVAVLESGLLPLFNPQSSFAKKEKTRFRSAENVVHLIPLLLLLCAFILWVFSGQDSKLQ